MRVDRLSIDAVVNDKFSETLENLSESLMDVAGAQRLVDENMTISVDTDGVRDLKKLNRELAKNQALASTAGATTVGGGAIPTPTPDGGGSSSGGATADGGRDSGRNLRKLVRTAQETFGDAFNPDVLANDADRAQRLTDFISSKPSEFIDTDALAEAVAEGTVDAGIVEDLQSDDDDRSRGAFRTLRRAGLTTLPTSADSAADNLLKRIQDFDATALNNLRASLFPLLVTFIGALPAAIAGVIALGGAAIATAAALGAVGAVGALGVVLADDQSLADIATNLKTSFIEEFGGIAEALRPTFMEAVDSVEQLFGSLADKAALLRGLTDDALNLQAAIERWLVGGFENVIGLAMVATDLFGALGSQVGDFSLSGAFAGVLAQLIDDLIIAASGIISMIPLILTLSEGFLRFVGALTSVLGWIGQLLNTFPLLTKMLGFAAAGILTAVSATLLWLAASKLLTGGLLETAVVGMGSMIKSAYGYVASMFASTAATYSTVFAMYQLLLVLSALTLGLYAVGSLAAMAASKWSLFGGEIHNARKELEKFSKVSANGDVGAFAASRSGRQDGQYVNYNDNRQTTIVAPDKQTGSKVSSKHEYSQRVAEQHTS